MTRLGRLLVAAGRWEVTPEAARAAIWTRVRQEAWTDVVHRTIAGYLGLTRDRIEGSQRIYEDLGLDAFDMAFVASTLARIAESEFPLHRLDEVRCVADLTQLVSAWAEESR
jgi:hypothetical protein